MVDWNRRVKANGKVAGRTVALDGPKIHISDQTYTLAEAAELRDALTELLDMANAPAGLTASELQGLRVGSIVKDRDGETWHGAGSDTWKLSRTGLRLFSFRLVRNYGPITLVSEPEMSTKIAPPIMSDCKITCVEQLDALPIGAKVVEADSIAWRKDHDVWRRVTKPVSITSRDLWECRPLMLASMPDSPAYRS